MKILFLGSSHFSLIVLKKMIEEGLNVSCIITGNDKPTGRGHKLEPNIVKVFGLENNIEVKTFDKIKLHIDEIKTIDYDIAVVASFGQILPDEFLNHKLCINVHPSLLPLYRGASPLQSAILNGDKESGVSIMKVASKVDAGDILMQEKVNIEGFYYSELELLLGEKGALLLADCIKNIKENKQTYTVQDDKKATFTRKFVKEDGLLNFNNDKEKILNQIKALSETVGCYISINNEIVKIEKAEIVDENNLKSCEIKNDRKHFIIGCKNGAIEVLECKPQSGKSISGRDYLNGHNQILGKSIDNA